MSKQNNLLNTVVLKAIIRNIAGHDCSINRWTAHNNSTGPTWNAANHMSVALKSVRFRSVATLNATYSQCQSTISRLLLKDLDIELDRHFDRE